MRSLIKSGIVADDKNTHVLIRLEHLCQVDGESKSEKCFLRIIQSGNLLNKLLLIVLLDKLQHLILNKHNKMCLYTVQFSFPAG